MQPGSDGLITREDLDAIKGVEGGLRAFAEDALVRSMHLGPEDREAFKALYSQLYNRQSEGTLTTWLMPRSSLEDQWDRPTPFADVLEAARSVRLLREDELRIEGGEPRRYIRLGHDALAKVAAAWRAEPRRRAAGGGEDEAAPAASEIGRRRGLLLDPGWTLRLARASEAKHHAEKPDWPPTGPGEGAEAAGRGRGLMRRNARRSGGREEGCEGGTRQGRERGPCWFREGQDSGPHAPQGPGWDPAQGPGSLLSRPLPGPAAGRGICADDPGQFVLVPGRRRDGRAAVSDRPRIGTPPGWAPTTPTR